MTNSGLALRRWLFAAIFAWAAAAGSPILAESLRLPAILGDHMVFQRGVPVPVWGWAEPGSSVAVAFKQQLAATTADADGRWRVDLDAMPADATPAVLTVTSGTHTLKINDVVVGEVWLCAGQSNMGFPVKRTEKAEQEISNADWPLIRHIKAANNVQILPQEDTKASWTVCSPQTVAEYTAVGYFFGRRLHQELDVPIGLLHCSWGGTRIEPWTPMEGFAAVPELGALYRTILLKLPTSDAYQEQAKSYLDSINSWSTEARQKLADGEALAEPKSFPKAIKPYTHHQDPTVLYNGMVSPFVPFAIHGIIWYQGESNRSDGMAYFDKSRALIEGLRNRWDNPALPFYFVQIAPYRRGNDDPFALPELWEAQETVARKISHTGMVVISDIGNVDDIHPTNKQGVGLRLANMALRRGFGRDDIVDNGPRFRKMRIDGPKVIVTFEQVAEGLACRGGQPLDGFELVGDGQPWTQARAKIVSADKLELQAKGIDAPTAVRFGWHEQAVPNLMNSVGLPAAPFRAGNAMVFNSTSLKSVGCEN